MIPAHMPLERAGDALYPNTRDITPPTQTSLNEPQDLLQRPTQHPAHSSLTQKVSKFVWASIGTCLTYKLLDKGLADLFCLETLTHGSGPKGFIGISLNGADPSFGGGSTGSTASLKHGDSSQSNLLKNAKNYFYLFKDSELIEGSLSPVVASACSAHNMLSCLALLPRSTATIFAARMHAIGGGVSAFTDNIDENEVKKFIGGLSGALTPTLKFRFKLEDVLAKTELEKCSFKKETQISIRRLLGDFFSFFGSSLQDYFNPQDIKDECWIETDRVFENDPDYLDVAYRTHQAIPANHIGITGSLTQGLDENTLTRMSDNPMKAMTGVFFLTLALATGYLTYKNYNRIPVQKVRERFLDVDWVDKINIVVAQSALAAFWLTTAMSMIFLSTL